MTPAAENPADAWLYALFRPRFALVAGTLTATVLVVGCAIVAAAGQDHAYSFGQRVATVLVGVACAGIVEALVNTSARATRDGLRVRNIVGRRTLAWPEIVAVRFSTADPWVTLDLTDGTTLAVMAIQRADGARGVRDANRLARLVAIHGQAVEPPPVAEGPPDPA